MQSKELKAMRGRKQGCHSFLGSIHHTGLPDFSWYNKPKREKITKIATKMPNGYAMYQIAQNIPKAMK
jgi:hypothetical protein